MRFCRLFSDRGSSCVRNVFLNPGFAPTIQQPITSQLHTQITRLRANMAPSFKTQPPKTSFAKISFPAEHVLLITLSRPKSLNCINSAGHAELDATYKWFDHEPSMRVAVLTGEGRAFCAGKSKRNVRGEDNPDSKLRHS